MMEIEYRWADLVDLVVDGLLICAIGCWSGEL
jgi:hypothetical protein